MMIAELSPRRLFLVLGGAIYFIELVIMFFLAKLLPSLSVLGTAFLDSTLLLAFTFPMLYFLVFRPLTNHISRSVKMEKKLLESAVAKSALEVEKLKNAEIEKAYSELQSARDLLVQSEKLASLGELSAGLAHELNSPLTGILGIARHYLERKDPNDREHGDMNEIVLAGERMAKIIRGLLEFSKPSKDEIVELNCNKVIDSVLDFGRGMLIGVNVDLRKEYQKDLPSVMADKVQLQQVIINIVDNAMAAMDNKGLFIIITRTMALAAGQFVEMEFIDDGSGINKKDLNKLFEPFFTTKRAQKGIGLGLSIAQSIVHQYGGQILVESPVAGKSKGAAFRVRIPVKDSV